MLLKDTEKGKNLKEVFDKNFPRKEVDKEELRELLKSLTFQKLIGVCIDSKEDLINLLLSKSDKDIDDSLFTYYHSTHTFAFRLKEEI